MIGGHYFFYFYLPSVLLFIMSFCVTFKTPGHQDLLFISGQETCTNCWLDFFIFIKCYKLFLVNAGNVIRWSTAERHWNIPPHGFFSAFVAHYAPPTSHHSSQAVWQMVAVFLSFQLDNSYILDVRSPSHRGFCPVCDSLSLHQLNSQGNTRVWLSVQHHYTSECSTKAERSLIMVYLAKPPKQTKQGSLTVPTANKDGLKLIIILRGSQILFCQQLKKIVNQGH